MKVKLENTEKLRLINKLNWCLYLLRTDKITVEQLQVVKDLDENFKINIKN